MSKFKAVSMIFVMPVLVAMAVGGCGGTKSAPLAGFDRMERPELLPMSLPVGTVTKQAACYDLTGGNSDGSYKMAYVMYVDDNNEPVIFDEWGPGCLYRMQMNVWCDTILAVYQKDADQARIKFYFDNEAAPRINMTFGEFFGGKVWPFDAPLGFKDWQQREPLKNKDGSKGWNLGPTTRFAINYHPMEFSKRLKVTVIPPPKGWDKRGTTWYQWTYLAYPTAKGVKTSDPMKTDSAKVRKQWNNLGEDPKPLEGNKMLTSTVSIAKGQSKIIFEQKGKGSVSSLKLKLEPYNVDTFYNCRILMYWDGMDKASVDLPLGYLFGGGGKDYTTAAEVAGKKLANLFYGFDGQAHTFYSYWPMPFWSAAKIEIINESGADISSLDCQIAYKPASAMNYPFGKAGYFSTQRTVDSDPGNGIFSKAFEEKGAGHIVGLNFYTQTYAMDGDEFTYLDGSRTPQIHGSGTEDDHDQGWGGDKYQKPLWGGVINGFQGAYRLYINEPYIFYDSAKINYEYSLAGGTTNSLTDIVYYYYKLPGGSRIELTDELDVGNAGSETAHDYKVSGQTWEEQLTSSYDGYEKKPDYDKLTDDGRAFKGYSEFTVKIDKKNDGVRLRKRLSRFENGMQTAKVFVDGKEVTEKIWQISFPSTAPKEYSFMDNDFTIPAKYTKGKDKARIKIEYAGSKHGEINEFYYWVYCFKK